MVLLSRCGLAEFGDVRGDREEIKEIICEAGVSFHGLVEATQMVFKAAEVGADFIKFQLYDDKVIEQVPERWRKHLKKVQLHEGSVEALMGAGKKAGIEVFFTPMFEKAVDWCEKVGVSRYKIRALDAYNDDLLLAVRQTNKSCYVSRNSYRKLDPLKQKYFYTLYYDEKRPTSIKDVMQGYPNLLRSDGYSSHCNKLLNVMSVMLFPMVNYIEVHCSLNPMDKTLPDWQYSFGFTDIYELCKFRDLLNSRARENPSKWEIS